MKSFLKALSALVLMASAFLCFVSCNSGVKLPQASIIQELPIIANGDTFNVVVTVTSNGGDTVCIKGALGQFSAEKCVYVNLK